MLIHNWINLMENSLEGNLVKEHGIEPIFASIRQISHEIMKSLKDELPEIVQLN